MTRDQWVPEYLLNYRRDHNLTQSQLATKLGVSQSQLSKWEVGKHVPSSLRIDSIMEILKNVELAG